MINSSLKFRRHAKCKIWKKWQLFHATDFQSLMYPCFALCHILGMFPYKINASRFETSKRCYILSTIIICILCIYELVTLYEINISNKQKTLPVTLERNCFFVLGFFFVVVTYISSGRRMHLLQTIMDISLRVSPDAYRKLSRLIHAKDIFGFFFLIGQMSLYFALGNISTLAKIFVVYIVLINFQMDMLHMNCVCVLKACFKEIDNNLTILRELMLNDKPHLVRRIYHKHKNPFLLNEFRALKKHHLVVSDTVEMLNNIFSVQLLTSILLTFSEITFHLYYYIVHWKTDIVFFNIHSQLYNLLLITSVTYNCIKIMLTGWACETGKDQATRIGITIHEILNSTIDMQITDELQLFSSQVLHSENTFSTKGLIIDATLLVAIVGNITTYLLILIQFLITEQICNEKIANNMTKQSN